MMKKTENILGFIAILLVVVGAKFWLKTDILFFRLLVGGGLGYALARAYTGFAGSVNRAYRTGSAKLMRVMMFLFFFTALITTAFLFGNDPTSYNIWIKPINLGLILGGFLFGFGMSLSVCCASGVLTDIPQGLPRAGITLLFFMAGVFFGFPIQNSSEIVRDSWVSTFIGRETMGGVFLPDYFRGDGLEGYLGALAVLALICGVVIYLSYLFEKHQKNTNKYKGHPMEEMQDNLEPMDLSNFKLFSSQTYEQLFVRPWTLMQGFVVISAIFALMMGVTGAGWGASQPYGYWFGKILMLFGFSPQALSEFTLMSPSVFSTPFFQDQISVQNFGILSGAVIYLLTAGKFREAFTSTLDIKGKEAALYALGGFSMGFGTRLANGCNVGALYTPIANFSLSGWIFLIFMVVGGILSNKFNDMLYSQ
jgi:hypothetical protein